MNKKVLLGMSGGVDSSVSAILLKKQGYEVIGATLKMWDDNNLLEEDYSSSACYDAKKVCDKLEIPHYVIDAKEEFKKYVIDNFTNCYKCARTPNPCVECNKYLKFGLFYKKAQELGCDYISTGHYARVEFSEKYNKYVMMKSYEEKKDQTYFLYNISPDVIGKILFPLAEFTNKNEIRKIAKKNELIVANKPDSQEICFIPNGDYAKFVIDNSDAKPKIGNIVLKTGEVLGKHNGIINYTIGQRKGLGVAYKNPLYVIRIDSKKNEVIVGNEEDLYTNVLEATDLNFLLFDKLDTKLNVKAKVRYRAKEADAVIFQVEEDRVRVEFKEPQRAITPGQSVVFYSDNIVVGGGIILK